MNKFHIHAHLSLIVNGKEMFINGRPYAGNLRNIVLKWHEEITLGNRIARFSPSFIFPKQLPK